MVRHHGHMRSKNTSLGFESGVVSHGQLGVAALLLVGVILLGYGSFQQSWVALYVGVAVVLAGVLGGMIQVVVRHSR